MIENILLTNVVTNVQIELDKVSTPDYALDLVDWDVINGVHHSNKYVGQVGESVLSTTLNTRPITITGWVLSNDGNIVLMKDRKDKLNSFVNPFQEIKLVTVGKTISFMPESTIKYSTKVNENNEYFCKFTIQGICFNPIFVDEIETEILAAAVRGAFKFPLVLKSSGFIMGRKTSSSLFNVSYSGVIETGFEIILKANGTLTNPKIINRDTNQFFKINKTLESGEVVRILSDVSRRRVIGIINGVEYNYFNYKDFDSSWLTLKRGDNVFKFEADSNVSNLEVAISFTNKYLEVQ